MLLYSASEKAQYSKKLCIVWISSQWVSYVSWKAQSILADSSPKAGYNQKEER